MVVVDQLVLFDDLPKQAFVGRTNESVSGAVDLREELPCKGNECSLATVDEKWRLIGRLASSEGRNLDYADWQGIPNFSTCDDVDTPTTKPRLDTGTVVAIRAVRGLKTAITQAACRTGPGLSGSSS